MEENVFLVKNKITNKVSILHLKNGKNINDLFIDEIKQYNVFRTQKNIIKFKQTEGHLTFLKGMENYIILKKIKYIQKEYTLIQEKELFKELQSLKELVA